MNMSNRSAIVISDLPSLNCNPQLIPRTSNILISDYFWILLIHIIKSYISYFPIKSKIKIDSMLNIVLR